MDLTAAAYQATEGGPLDVDRDFYRAIANDGARKLTESIHLPIRSGIGWKIPAGSVCRITTIEGPQVADLNLWSADNPRERFWASRTKQLHAAHLTTFNRLWSTLPYLRPMATIVADTLENYGVDTEGGRVHDLLGTRCDPYVNRMLTGEDFDYHCHSNLVRAVLPFGMTEFDVHDVLNVFQCTGLNDKDQYFMKTCPAKKGDYFEFFAEIDLIAALSTCPGGDLSVPLWGPDAKDPVDVCRPLGIEVFKPTESLLAGWSQPEFAQYAGRHGLKAKPWE
ncbi:MAG: DUF1989 domain-containing protein [Actinomycetes bacterium]